MKGIVARHGYKSKYDWATRVQKKKRKQLARKCFLCGKPLLCAHGNSLYHGNQRKKIGCAYKMYVLRNKEWKRKVKYHLRPNVKKKQRVYGRKYDLKRVRDK